VCERGRPALPHNRPPPRLCPGGIGSPKKLGRRVPNATLAGMNRTATFDRDTFFETNLAAFDARNLSRIGDTLQGPTMKLLITSLSMMLDSGQ